MMSSPQSNGCLDAGRRLPLVEDFYTLQGEGAHTGRAAYFIRLGGCDVGCCWCDSRQSWNADAHPLVEVGEIARRAAAHPARIAIVTGGEPLLHPLSPLCDELHAAGFEVFLETSGTRPFSGSFDWVCLSPKRHRPPTDEAWERADEIKVVVAGPDDLQWADRRAEKAAKEQLFLQPEWSRAKEVLPMIVDYIKQNPHWRLSLQTHKYIHIP